MVAGTVAMTMAAAGLAAVLAASSDAATSYSLFAKADTTKAKLDPESADLELGLRFSVSQPGTVEKIRFLKAPGDIGSRDVTLWSGRGKKLASVRTASETASGWQEITLPKSVALRAGGSYVVSYHARRYMATEHYFDRAATVGPVKAPAGRNGVYRYGSGFPTASYQASSYWVDVVFSTAPGTSNPVPAPTLSNVPSPTMKPTLKPTVPPTTPPATSKPPTVTPTTPGATTPPDSGAALKLPRIAWDGGPAFYKKFPKADAAGWDDPSFFPISVFLGKPEHAPKLAALGINTYMGAEHDGSRISSITGAGISVLAQDEWSKSEIGDDPKVVGHLVSDECDMSIGCSGSNTRENLAAQKKMVSELRARNDGRFMQANYGNGVLGTFWASGTMAEFVQAVDVTSVDKYAYTSSHVQGLLPNSPAWPDGAEPASSGAYGWLSDRMRSYMNQAALQPNWVFVETGRPFLTESDSLVIRPEQIEGAVWSSLIHEARGIAYFQHSNDRTCATYSLVDCDQARKDKVKAISAQVRSLAPVLNTQSYVWDFAAGTDTMLKTYGGSAYVFAGVGLKQSTGSKTFTLPAGVTGGTVTVVDENRTIPVVGGKFTDSFAGEYTHHIYKVSL